MRVVWFWLPPLAVLLLACSNLGEIQRGVCGNGIVEPGEDCDAHTAGCGLPLSAHPCRFTCDPAKRGTPGNCPTGYRCGADSVCRAPTGEFSKAHAIPGGQTLAFSVGDVDGDYSDDIVSLTQGGWVGVDFLDSSGLAATARSRTFQLPFALGKFTAGDDRYDIAHLPDFRLDVLTGASNRTLQSLPYAGIPVIGTAKHAVIFSMDAAVVPPSDTLDYPMLGGAELMALDGSRLYVAVANELLPTVTESSDKLAPRLRAGAIPVGHIDESLPCQQFVLADAGATQVSVYSPCAGPGTDWNTDEARYPKVQLPAGAEVGDGVLLTDLDGDGHLDMLIAGKAPKDTPVKLYEAFGNGKGEFNSKPLASGVTPDSTAAPLAGVASGLPLAVGDLNGDSIEDFVFPGRVAEGTANCFQSVTCWKTVFPGQWTQALIGDFNENHIPDIVAVPKGARYVDFYNGTGGTLFNKSSIQTNGYPTSLTVGDFDGDLVPDIAITEASDLGSCPSKSRTDHLSIMFGAPAEPPSAPVDMGDLDCIPAVAAGNFFFAGGVDWTSDLAVLATAQDGTQKIALFPGSTDRQLYAPFPLDATVTGNVTHQDSAIAVAAGKFDNDNANDDLAVVALAGDSPPRKLRLYNVPVTGSAELSNSYAGGIIEPTQLPLKPCSTLAVRANFYGGSLYELMLLGRATTTGGLVAVAAVDPKTHEFKIEQTLPVTDVPLVRPFTSRFLCGLARDPYHLQTFDLPYSSEVQAAHLVDSSTEQVVALGRGAAPAKSVLRVFSWKGPGHPIVEKALTPPDNIDPVAFTVLKAASGPARKIALATTDALYLCDLDAAHGTISGAQLIDNLQAVPPPHIPGDGIAQMLGIESGDFNGDGVEDLAVGSQAWFDLFYGIPKAP